MRLSLSQQIYNHECPDQPVHLACLVNTNDHRSAEVPDNVEQLVQLAKDQCENLSATRDESAKRKAIASALQEIRRYAPILDVFTQGAPSAVSVCWGTIRIVLEVCACHGFQQRSWAVVFMFCKLRCVSYCLAQRRAPRGSSTAMRGDAKCVLLGTGPNGTLGPCNIGTVHASLHRASPEHRPLAESTDDAVSRAAPTIQCP